MNTGTTRILHGVRGPTGEPGVLLLAPASEALDWDLRDEVASTSRYWMADRQAWWVAAPYASTAIAIATRFNGDRPPLQEPPAAATVAAQPIGGQRQALQPVLQRLSEWFPGVFPRPRVVSVREVRLR